MFSLVINISGCKEKKFHLIKKGGMKSIIKIKKSQLIYMKKIIILLTILILNNCYSQSIIYLEKARNAVIQENYESAILYFNEALSVINTTEKYMVYLERAVCYYELKDYANAELDIKKALKVNKKCREYKYLKTNSYWLYYQVERKNGITKKSIKYLKKATKYSQSTDLYSTLGYAECYLGKYKSALKNLNKALEIDSTNSFAHNNLGLVYLNLNQLDLARIEVNKSIQLDNQNPYAYKNSALIYIAEGNIESACVEINKAKEIKIPADMTGNDLEELDTLMKKYCNP